MKQPYEPRPNTGAARALAFLRALGPGAEVPTAALAGAGEFDQRAASAFMAPCVRAGLVKNRSVERSTRSGPPGLLWSLGDGTPVRVVAVQRKPRAALAPAEQPKAPLLSVFDVSPAHRFDPEAAPPVFGSFMDDWRRKRGEVT